MIARRIAASASGSRGDDGAAFRGRACVMLRRRFWRLVRTRFEAWSGAVFAYVRFEIWFEPVVVSVGACWRSGQSEAVGGLAEFEGEEEDWKVGFCVWGKRWGAMVTWLEASTWMVDDMLAGLMLWPCGLSMEVACKRNLFVMDNESRHL